MKPRPASSRTLSAFAIDIEYELEQMVLFSEIIIKKTGLANCGLNIICTIAKPSTAQTDIAQALERVWHEAALGYGQGKDSCEISTATGEVQMQFSAATEESIVTGRVEVLGFD